MVTIDLDFKGMPGAIAAFLVPTSEGIVLIETGPHSTLPILKKGVVGAGYQFADIKHVLLSHIHLDHAGAAWYLARQGAKVYVHSRGYTHLKDPKKLMASAKRIYKDQMDQLWGQMHSISEDQLVNVGGDQPITIGDCTFKPWYTPGHAKHHIAWQWGDMLFTGDVAGVKIAKGPVMPPCPPPDIEVALWIRSLHLIHSLKFKTLQLTHFGPVSEVSHHLEELEERLVAWSNWIKPYWENQTPAPEIVDPFQQYVRKHLLSNGLSATEVETYEAANPSWMSVYGLLRYWQQKS